jgi:hypothetical protein
VIFENASSSVGACFGCFHGSYSYPCLSSSSQHHLIYAIVVEEERAAAQSRASKKDVNLFQVRQRAHRTLQSEVGLG